MVIPLRAAIGNELIQQQTAIGDDPLPRRDAIEHQDFAFVLGANFDSAARVLAGRFFKEKVVLLTFEKHRFRGDIACDAG